MKTSHKQRKVNREVKREISIRKGKENAITRKQLFDNVKNIMPHVTRSEISQAIRQMRANRKPVISMPGIGYFYDSDQQAKKNCIRWVENWRRSTGKTPISSVLLNKII